MIKKFTFLILSISLFLQISAQEETRLLRFPGIFQDQVVFSYAGDLYLSGQDGNFAQKLTNHDGYEMFAKFSPDGKYIAFTGQYDGNTEVFVIPSTGGSPKRLTYTATLSRDDVSDRMGPNNIVMAWTPDSKYIVYRSRKQSFNSFVGQLFKVSIEGGLSEELPLPDGGFCTYNSTGDKLAYNRVFREFRTWKYYQGGMADDVWIYDFKSKKTENITSNNAQDIFPMWYKDQIYFLSDRDRTMNLFVYNSGDKSTKKLTDFTEYDIKFPSINGNQIVFENAGYLYVYKIDTQKLEKLSISITGDFEMARPRLEDISSNITSFSSSPGGERIAVSARGEIFNIPAKEGIAVNLTNSSGAHDRNVEWSPDGKYIAWISDKSGEFEIYMQKHDGSEPPIQLTKDADTYYYNFKWSPDSKKILWGDKKMRLRYIDIESKKVTLVHHSKQWEMRDFDWSLDSKWIAFSRPEPNQMNKICLYNLENKGTTEVSDYWFGSSSPRFTSDGKYLVFASNREFNPIYSATEWNHAYSDMERLYLVTLDAETPSPFAPKNDEIKEKEDKKDTEKKKDKSDKDEKESKDIKIDLGGIQDRIIALPTDAGRYWNVSGVDGKIYYNFYKTGLEGGSKLMMYDLEKEKETEIAKNVGYEISSDTKKMLISRRGKLYLVSTPTSSVKFDDEVDTKSLKMYLDPVEEWNQIYNEAWRQMRDFFYVSNMHGVNWDQMREKYAALLPYVKNRNDLSYLIGELIGELNVGHAYIGGGDRPKPERIKTGLLGAKIEKADNGYFKIKEILKGANWSKELRSPLTEMGVNAKEGDYIVAINGKDLKDVNDLYKCLVGKAETTVEISLNSKPSLKDARSVLIQPLADESSLYYYNWVQDNIKKVSEATDGQVGYIHIPDMGREGLNEFVKHFYPQLDKKALIIDDRGNGGGNVSPMIMERLRREITRSNMVRNATIPTQTPRQMLIGPKVLLINNYSASDGDLFPYSFKKHNLGKVIGKRSWGGVVGIRGSLPFVDGADLRKPEFASYSADTSDWIIEGWGVEPDIYVDNDPAKEYAGEDEQLNKAIEVILEELKNWNYVQPGIPNPPDKSGKSQN